MSKIDPGLFRKWKAGQDAHNLFVLQERKNATYQERFRALSNIWARAIALGYMNSDKPYDMSVNETWQRLRTAYLNRHA